MLGYPEQAGIETYLIERKLDNCKPCGGAIPLCMIDEFDLPKDIVDREARRMKFDASPLLLAILSNFPLLASPKTSNNWNRTPNKLWLQSAVFFLLSCI